MFMLCVVCCVSYVCTVCHLICVCYVSCVRHVCSVFYVCCVTVCFGCVLCAVPGCDLGVLYEL